MVIFWCVLVHWSPLGGMRFLMFSSIYTVEFYSAAHLTLQCHTPASASAAHYYSLFHLDNKPKVFKLAYLASLSSPACL